MEAKGCAKPAVWKNARRSFYWAVRARIAQSSALAKLAEAKPDATFEFRSKLLNSLSSLGSTTDHRMIAKTLEQLDMTKIVAKLKADSLARSLLNVVNEDRKAAMDGLMCLVENLNGEERARLQAALQNVTHTPGRCCLETCFTILKLFVCSGVSYIGDHSNLDGDCRYDFAILLVSLS
jgi:acetyl-CoA carboxylase/biotin carboxylase 1